MDLDMNMAEQNRSCPVPVPRHIGPEVQNWLSKNLTDLDLVVNSILTLVEEHERSTMENETNHLNKTELVAGVHELHRLYQSLAIRCDHLTQAMQHNSNAKEFQPQGSVHKVSSLYPREKPHRRNPLSVSDSSGGGSPDLSLNRDYESSSLSDSESESYISSVNNYPDSPKKTEKEPKLTPEKQKNQVVDEEWILKLEDQRKYGELIDKVIQYEEELRIQNLKLQLSEQEVKRLELELVKCKSVVVLVENLRTQLEDSKKRGKMLEGEVEAEKLEVIQLQKKVLDLESRLSNSCSMIENLTLELGMSRESLKYSEKELVTLREKLCRDEQNFSFEKAKLQSETAILSEKKALLEERLRGLELNNKGLEDRVGQHEAERREIKACHDAEVTELQLKINALRSELAVKCQEIEELNKEGDAHKLELDVLKARKDEVSATVEKLNAELRSRDVEMKRAEDRFVEVRSENNIIRSECESARNMIAELKARVNDLEKEMERQRMRICEGEEEKREAVRQLCFTLDHYKTGYRELCRHLSAQNRQAMAAV